VNRGDAENAEFGEKNRLRLLIAIEQNQIFSSNYISPTLLFLSVSSASLR
jgi:hypothetical protein